MSEYDEPDETFDTSTPAPEASASESVDYWKKRAQKAEEQAVERRVALRRYEAAAKHGVPAEKIPDWVPADKLEEFVSQFVVTATTDTGPSAQETPEAAPEKEPAPEEPVAVAGPAPTDTRAQPGERSGKELFELYKQDPARATQEAIAKYQSRQ